jgi:transposase-like protein
MEGDIRWIPVSAAAQLLGVSRQRVHVLARESRLASRKINDIVLVSVRSIEDRIRAKSLGRLKNG